MQRLPYPTPDTSNLITSPLIFIILVAIFSKKFKIIFHKKGAGQQPFQIPTKEKVKVKQITGEVAAVDAAAKTLTVKSKKVELAITTDEKTEVKIDKEKKIPCRCQDRRQGDCEVYRGGRQEYGKEHNRQTSKA
jgi:hypothetical protein